MTETSREFQRLDLLLEIKNNTLPQVLETLASLQSDGLVTRDPPYRITLDGDYVLSRLKSILEGRPRELPGMLS